MARLYTDGAETLNMSLIERYGWNQAGYIYTTQKRSGAASYRITSGGVTRIHIYINANWGNIDELYLRWGQYFNQNHGGVFWIMDTSGTQVMRLDYSSGACSLYTPNTWRDGAGGFDTGKWFTFECHFKLHDTSGVATIRCGGHEIMSWEGDTKPDADAYIGSVAWGTGASYQETYVDDIAINDTSGSDQNSWVGDGHVLLLSSGSEGDNIDFSPLSGTDNALMVDELAPDGDTTYNYTSGSGNYDLLKVEQSGLSSIVIPVVTPLLVAKETTASGELIDTGLKVGGVEYWDLYNHAILDAYVANLGKPYYNNPGGGVWTVAALNNLQIGYKSK